MTINLDTSHTAPRAKSKRGRKPDNRAAMDFRLGYIADLYYEKLDQFQQEDAFLRAAARSRGDKLPKGGWSPGIRAAQYVLDCHRHKFRNISARRLINRLCEFGWLRTNSPTGEP